MLEKSLAKNIFTKSIITKATRDGFGEALVELGQKNKQVVVLCADVTESTRCEAFAQKFPERFFEVGVAEQNLAGLAAGLALAGKIPFISSYAVFSPGRNWEQIRVGIAYNKANVKIIGGHSGLSVGPDGATHQALEDLALMRVLPNLTVIAPSDYEETKQAVLATAKIKGPVYLRLTRQATPVFTTTKTPFKVGRAEIFWTGQNPQVTIIAGGPVVYSALLAAQALAQKKINSLVVNNHTIKPLDQLAIIKAAQKTGAVVVVEEHQINGGLFGAVAELLAQKFPVPIEAVAMLDKFGESGEAQELLDKYQINTRQIIAQAKKVIRRKK
ncbi:MAG: transketolase C-terminal domain-containing protein [Candidatus Buchananbacteria bacterium]